MRISFFWVVSLPNPKNKNALKNHFLKPTPQLGPQVQKILEVCVPIPAFPWQKKHISKQTAKSPKIPSHVPNQNPASESLVLPKAETWSMQIRML